jgi:hypothetical protein
LKVFGPVISFGSGQVYEKPVFSIDCGGFGMTIRLITPGEANPEATLTSEG